MKKMSTRKKKYNNIVANLKYLLENVKKYYASTGAPLSGICISSIKGTMSFEYGYDHVASDHSKAKKVLDKRMKNEKKNKKEVEELPSL